MPRYVCAIKNAPTGASTIKMPLYERTIKTIRRGRAGVKTHAHKYNKSEPLMFFNTKIMQKVLVIRKTAVILSPDNKTDWADSQQLNNKSNMNLTLLSGRGVTMHTAEDLANFTGYDHATAQCQIANCGYFFTDTEFGDVVDNEFDLSECYQIIAEMRANKVL